jgi:Carboxypeptidase regulatory-like domain/TonB-dependent Receptor Plug Domain
MEMFSASPCKGGSIMRRLLITVMVLMCVSATRTFAQTGNASIGGFVQDTSRAFIPGVSVTATNAQTGVATAVITNESGTYNIPSLLPGIYKLSAELPGFRTQVFNDVQLGANTTGRYNFTLEVGSVNETVEVTAQATNLIAETSPTIGQVLTEDKVRDLPLVSNNVLDLMKTMPGVRGGIFSSTTTFAGIGAQAVNTVRDGLSVQEGRYANGVGSTTLVNPDMVGEFRVILTPVDAELGRGNGQVQIITRSGTNQFRGSAVWNIRNSALDANTWYNNRRIVRGQWRPSAANWQNEHEYSASLGGPIIKNKTFFFTLWDQQFERDRTQMRPVVLTDCARNGIFRYWEGYQNGNINQVPTALPTNNPLIAVVDSFGNPLRPATNPNGTPYTGQLRYFSVFGPLANTPTRPDCSDAAVQDNAWDSNRTSLDPAGITQRYLGFMPRANIFDGGDGLNTAVHEWQFRAHGTGDLDTAYGTSFVADHHQINTKIDHNFSARHKVAVNYSHQWIDNDYIPVSGPTTQWPGGYLSKTIRRPRVLTVNFTSTLTPSLLNEARYGYRANWHYVWAPWEVPNVQDREVPLSLMRSGSQGFPIVYTPATVGNGNTQQGTLTTVGFTCNTGCAQQGNNTPLFNYSDTLSWTKGKHGFRGGVDLRFAYTKGYETPTAPIPKAYGGEGLNPTQVFSNNPAMPGLTPNNQTLANSLLYFLSGSLDRAQQYYHLYSPDNLVWGSYLDHDRKLTWAHQNDFSFFFKDDWKVHPSFTLNLGARYEYYGVPYHHSGLTPVPIDGGLALFGVSGRSFDRWMRMDNPVDLNLRTQIELVGPHTKNRDKSLYKNDWNNIGPAVGFAWQLPWFGKGKTNVRGGYQISYVKGSNLATLVNSIFLNPGFSNLAQTRGPVDGTYFNLLNLQPQVPIPPSSEPLQPIPLQKLNQNISAYDPNFVAPYIQNFTLSLTRDISRNFTLDVRYIGTRGLKLDGNFNLNTSNVYYNPVLLDAVTRTRAGENVDLFDQMFLGLNLNPNVRGCDPSNPTALCAPVNGTTQRGSQHLRLISAAVGGAGTPAVRTALANGDFEAISEYLNVYNGTGSSAVQGVPGERGTVLTRANRGFNVPGGTVIAGGPVVPAGLFPSNWITANPQFNQTNYYTNSGKSNYHSMQVQGTLRPKAGLGVQGTYVWSRLLGVNASTFTDPTQRDEYTLLTNHITHDFRANGTFELPFGPNKVLFRNSSGWVARVVEGWQSSFIVNLNSGQPTSVIGGNMLYDNGVPDVVGPFASKSFGRVEWNGDSGTIFGSRFKQVPDPQCALLAADLKGYCTLQAIADAKTGQILLQNPQPGKRGTLGRNTMEMPGQWAFDAAMSKTVRITETKIIQLRLDATNVLNHPNVGSCSTTSTTPPLCNPNLNINSTTNPFGNIQDKGTQRREFKAMLRFNF